jgi:hypothetical protein
MWAFVSLWESIDKLFILGCNDELQPIPFEFLKDLQLGDWWRYYNLILEGFLEFWDKHKDSTVWCIPSAILI